MRAVGGRPPNGGNGLGPRRTGGDSAHQVGRRCRLAREERGPLPTREGGRCPRGKGAVAHERRGPLPTKRGAVAHEERGLSPRGGGARPTKGGGLPTKRRDGLHGEEGRAREDGVRTAGGMAHCEGEGHPVMLGECARVVTERIRVPAPNSPPQRVLSAGSHPGPKSAQLRPKSEAYVDVPRSSRHRSSHGRFHANSTEGSLRS